MGHRPAANKEARRMRKILELLILLLRALKLLLEILNR